MYPISRTGLRRLALPVATLATFAAFGLVASPALADQNINVPCSGNPASSGPAGLIAAINNANSYTGGKTTINVANACAYVFSKSNNSNDGSGNALPQIKSTIVIQGQGGPDEAAILMRSAKSGTPAFRLIDVKAGANLTLNSVQVTNGLTPNGNTGGSGTGNQNGTDGGSGGGIFSSGTLTLQDSVVSGNVTGNGGMGGNATNGNANGGNGGPGAGVYINGGSLNTNGGDHISGNVTGNGGNGGNSTGGNANGGNGGNGAGIATATGSDNLQDNTTLSSNTTGDGGNGGTVTGTGTANGGNGGNGGGSHSAGGTTVTINGGNTNVEQNNTGMGGTAGTSTAGSASAGNGGDGGGVFTSGTVSLNGTAITENIAGNAQQSTSSTSGNGGGLAAESGGKVTLQNGSFTWNVAKTGGAVFSSGSTVTVSGTKFANNTNPNCSPSSSGCPATD